jgi:phosphoglycolate phosphatase
MAPHLPSLSAAEIEADLESSAAIAPMIPTVPLVPLLGALRRDGYALGVATNATMAETRPHLDACRGRVFFDFVAGCDSGFGAKPGPGHVPGFRRASGMRARDGAHGGRQPP